jgi:O-methyltransferase involved in polyketide biosynthesis
VTENPLLQLDEIPETMLATLYIRALETQRPDALLKDEKAVALVRESGPAFERVKRIYMDEEDRVTIILRNREIDNTVRDFLRRRSRQAVVYLGCGLDARFERVDDGRVDWYDLDVPQVIELRGRLLGGEAGRYRLLAGSAFDHSWFNAVGPTKGRDFLFVAEGLFQYFHGEEVKSLVVALRERFPGSELVLDAFAPFLVHGNNLRMRLSRMPVRYHWGLGNGREIERWAEGIRLLDEWFPFSRPEPRLAKLQWARNIPLVGRAIGVYHYRLGEAPPAN